MAIASLIFEEVMVAVAALIFSNGCPLPKAQPGGVLKGLKHPLNDQNIDVYFLSFSPTLYCKSKSGALQNVLWQYHRRSNAFVIKPSGAAVLCQCGNKHDI